MQLLIAHAPALINTTITRDARIALVGRASSQWSFQCAPPSLVIIAIAPTVTLFSISI